MVGLDPATWPCYTVCSEPWARANDIGRKFGLIQATSLTLAEEALGELGATQLVTHSIDTGDHAPIRYAPGRTFLFRKNFEEMVAEMMGQGLIQPSKSPWASPFVLVTRKMTV